MSDFNYSNDLNFDWETVGEELTHLSRNELKDIMSKYYIDKDLVQNILDKYKLKINPSVLVRNFPMVKTEYRCPYDGEIMDIRLLSRSSSNIEGDIVCPKCHHDYSSSFCNCINCKNKRKKEAEEKRNEEKRLNELKRNILIEDYNIEEKQVALTNISLKERLYVATLLRAMMSEDLLEILPYNNRGENLTPFADLDISIISKLYDNHLIKVNAYNSNLDAFVFDMERELSSEFYLSKVIYDLNIETNLDKKESYQLLRYPDSDLYYRDKDATLKIWKLIGRWECLAYLSYSLSKVNLKKSNFGEKTNDIIDKLLDVFSIGQIYSLIFTSINSALRYQKEKDLSDRHTQNVVISNLGYYAAKSKDEGWHLKNYEKPRSMGRDAISSVFFEEILGINSKGWTEVPSIDFIPDNED